MLRLVPAIDMKFSSVLEYYNSFKNKGDINSFTICSIRDGMDKYFELVAHSYETLFYLVDNSNPNYIIGFGSIDNSSIRDYHLDINNDGNISYGVRINERNKGYGNAILNLLLLECAKLGMKEVCVSCNKDNLASRKIIEKNGGKFSCEFTSNWDGKIGLKYWIDISYILDKASRGRV